ncbi:MULTISPECIES: hypothetical protein [Paenarthrobacter]|uniref:Uncharacterized protein n=1 Tax=Paenarthrobacter ureafaciens TaxID=37931 RepID=A0AAX3ED46_PAEUR|nr:MULTISPECIES: hypothetical protein [Paenarthrobacter]NKR13340.1 hypothetical protein [Arthrobacter sp. M5]NKR14810.1 hypothetical protein [Arthrobacter sp. M6]OEH62365.1 hypothetical protein A5N13_01520 [Arthrobacter sp. D4]OEH62936.1 hypothetical protein A5N17_09760 [Arthrobacter sp. D2]MDO5865108.1 hypothetical protein [Paenarthrobacter sp. SD-2]
MADLSNGPQSGPEHGQRPTSYTPEQLVAIRGATPDAGAQRGPSSQAGLGAVRGPRYSVPSSPAPGQPGSRFNPNVVERRPRPQAEPAPGMITSADVPKPGQSRTVQGPAKVPLTQRAAEPKVGRAVQSEGFREGAKRLGTHVIRDAAAHAARGRQSGASTTGVAASAAKGAAMGAARGLHTELSGHGEQKLPQGSAAGADLVGRMGSIVGRGAREQTPVTAQQGRKPVSERYDYQFEGQDGPEGIEHQRGA